MSGPAIHSSVTVPAFLEQSDLDPVHTGPEPYGHYINLTSFKTSMTLKFVIILQNLIKTYHRKSGKSKCDRKVTELNVEITRIRSRVNGVLILSESPPRNLSGQVGMLF